MFGGQLIKLRTRVHPSVLFSYEVNNVELIIRVENHEKEPLWFEADVKVPEGISLLPTDSLQKGRIRIGILNHGEFIEKSVKIYANSYTSPRVYRGTVVLFAFDKDAVIKKRIEKPFDVLCEVKKEATF